MSRSRGAFFVARAELFLTSREELDYYPASMHASRFSFAFTYRYFFTGSGEADGVLTKQR
jgi:hypothetical protein